MTNNQKLDEVQKLLNKPLHPALIERRETGRHEPYISTTTAITQANRIIGALNWYIEIVDHRMVKNDVEPIGYQCTVRIHIPSCAFQGEGIGFNALTTKDGKLLQTPESHDTAIKGAESDAVKRALRYLGDPFANFLYEDTAVRRAMANAAIPVVAQRLGIGKEEAENIIRRPYSKLEEVPLNTSMGHYYGRDFKPGEQGDHATEDNQHSTNDPPPADPAQNPERLPDADPSPTDSTQEDNEPRTTPSDAAPQQGTQPNPTGQTAQEASSRTGVPEHDDLDDDADPFSPA